MGHLETIIKSERASHFAHFFTQLLQPQIELIRTGQSQKSCNGDH